MILIYLIICFFVYIVGGEKCSVYYQPMHKEQKWKKAFALGLFGVNLNKFACGNNGWNADAVPPKQCVIVTGSSSVSVSGGLMWNVSL